MDSTPWWFRRALDAPSEVGSVDVGGAAIHFEAWGRDGPGVVLVHGTNAHLEWWRFVAPFLADTCRVAAFDLSGSGDSGWRERYTGGDFADETWRVCQAAGLGERPIVVGHSFGGYVALEAAHRYGAELAGAIFLDYTLPDRSRYHEWGARARTGAKGPRSTRVYASLEAALERFRLVPEQPIAHPAVVDHVGRQSLRPVEGGSTWKFDPTAYDHLEMGPDQLDKFAALKCRSAVILGEHTEDEGALFGDHMAAITAGKLPIITLPTTHHHMMFEMPVALAMTLAGIARAWAAEEGKDAMAAALASIPPPAKP